MLTYMHSIFRASALTSAESGQNHHSHEVLNSNEGDSLILGTATAHRSESSNWCSHW